MEKEMIYKSRGFSSCINSAYHLMSANMKGIIRSTWLPVLLMSLLCGMLVILYVPNEKVVAFALANRGLYLTLIIVGVLGILLCNVWLYSRLMSMLNDQPRLWNFKRVLLTFIYMLGIELFVTLIISAAFFLAIRATGGNPLHFLIDNWLVVLIVFVLLVIALLPFYYIVMRYLYDKEASFWSDLPKTYETGLCHLGIIFITTLLTSIIVGVIAMVATIPLGILNIANLLSFLGRLNGDPATLPGYFQPLLFFTTVLVVMVTQYIYMFPIVVYLFIYGSIEKEKEERHSWRDRDMEERHSWRNRGMEERPQDESPSPSNDTDPHLPLQRLN